ncbi:MAG: VanZ family protein [Enterococcus sp.]|nr:VanZ family protein [Enterococcus sp.]
MGFGIDVPQQNLDYNIRKLAHFLEFAILGVILCNVYAAFGVSHRTATGYILFLGLAVAIYPAACSGAQCLGYGRDPGLFRGLFYLADT